MTFEEYDKLKTQYVELFGEKNLFTTIFMTHEEVAEIFRECIRKKQPYKMNIPKGVVE